MRCEDCLPLVEEYFDGEVTGQTGESITAHLASCATCAAALDALSFEREIYARYDRRLEVTPDLWSRVSAEIARTPHAERPAETRPFMSRALESLTAALGALTNRPALAASLALLVFGGAAGSLWLTRAPRSNAGGELAASVANPRAAQRQTTSDNVAGGDANTAGSLKVTMVGSGGGPAESVNEPASTARDVRRESEVAKSKEKDGRGETSIDVEKLLAATDTLKSNPNLVVINPDEHAPADDAVAMVLNASVSNTGLAAGDVRPLDPDEKDVARHFERTQMLLRSIKNARAGDDGSVDVAYEKKLSRKLLAENSTLKLEAEVKGDKDTRQVLDQLEPFLLDIANMGEKPSREEVRSIGERVTRNEIVAALQVY